MFKGFFKFIVMLFLFAISPQLFVLGLFIWIGFKVLK